MSEHCEGQDIAKTFNLFTRTKALMVCIYCSVQESAESLSPAVLLQHISASHWLFCGTSAATSLCSHQPSCWQDPHRYGGDYSIRWSHATLSPQSSTESDTEKQKQTCWTLCHCKLGHHRKCLSLTKPDLKEVRSSPDVLVGTDTGALHETFRDFPCFCRHRVVF